MSDLNKKLDFYVNKNLNVLFEGKHGIGKSTIILDCFKRNNLNYLYFSTATMDPWVDFVGVPKEKKTEEGHSYIELIRPKAIADDKVEAIFFDEFNRSPKKVRNAVMELLQFKSINGKKLNNLKIIWAAINPDDDEDLKFDVEKLDPAQRDRFHAFIKLPYKPDLEYLTNKYSNTVADIIDRWWKPLDSKIKDKVSPRRIDYALEIYNMGGDLRDILPSDSNVSELISKLKTVSIREKLATIYNKDNKEEAKKLLTSANMLREASPVIEENKEYIKYFLPMFKDEDISTILTSNKATLFKKFIMDNREQFKTVIENVEKITKVAITGDKINTLAKYFTFANTESNENEQLAYIKSKSLFTDIDKIYSSTTYTRTYILSNMLHPSSINEFKLIRFSNRYASYILERLNIIIASIQKTTLARFMPDIFLIYNSLIKQADITSIEDLFKINKFSSTLENNAFYRKLRNKLKKYYKDVFYFQL